MGENALEKTVRLLARVNERFADPGNEAEQFVALRLKPDGAGCLYYADGEVMYEFAGVEQLTGFLDGSLASQVKAIAGQ